MEAHKNILIVGDLHIDNRKTSICNSENFDEIYSLFNLITDNVLERRPEFVVFLGDIFDSPDNISTNVISIVSRLFDNLSKLVKVIIIAGNHDSVDDRYQKVDLTDGKSEYLRASLVYPLSLNTDIYVVDKPTTVNLDDLGLATTLTFIPYQLNIIEALESVKNSYKEGFFNIMFGHFETRDLNYVKLLKDSSIMEKIPSASELFTAYKQNLVILGHVHDASIIRDFATKGILYYTGSARNINFNNKDASKGIYSLDLESNQLELIPNNRTAIYKIFRDTDELDKFLNSTPDEELAKTKVKFIYTDSKDTLKYHPFKKKLRRLEFEKSIFVQTTKDIPDSIDLDLEMLKMDNLMVKDNLLNFILDFQNITSETKAEYLAFLKEQVLPM